MRKLTTSFALLFASSTAFAHPGHSHDGNVLVHHLLDYVGVGIVALLAYGCARYAYTRLTARNKA